MTERVNHIKREVNRYTLSILQRNDRFFEHSSISHKVVSTFTNNIILPEFHLSDSPYTVSEFRSSSVGSHLKDQFWVSFDIDCWRVSLYTFDIIT